MRTIKFRGKRLKIDDPLERWIEGSLAIWSDMYDRRHICIVSGVGHNNDIDPDTVGQFTGLYDKNGKEIYEGDILIEPSVATVPLEVRYNEKQCAFCLIEHTHTEGPLLGTCPLGDMLRHYPFMKVVGNIHDNPELLKGDTQ